MRWRETDLFFHVAGLCKGVKRVLFRSILRAIGCSRLYGLTIRPGTTDLWTVMETFERQNYLPLCNLPDIRVIVDLGANIGDTSVYFARHYPSARIVAVECDDDNYTLLVRNCRPYGNIIPVKGVIWGGHEQVRIVRQGGHDAFFAEPLGRVATDEAVAGLTLSDLMVNYQLPKIDILKVDVEGAERQIFDADCPWLSDVKALAIELHEEKVSGCTAAFFSALCKWFRGDYQVEKSGELIVVKRRADKKGG